jgi:hypothetical protein
MGHGLGPGPLRQVVVGVVGATGLVLEPLAAHTQTRHEGVELLVAVGHQMGPAVVDGAESGGLPPVVEVHGHRGSGPPVGLR